jgi:hypothetical protein
VQQRSYEQKDQAHCENQVHASAFAFVGPIRLLETLVLHTRDDRPRRAQEKEGARGILRPPRTIIPFSDGLSVQDVQPYSARQPQR